MSTARRSARRANKLTRRRPWLLPVLAGLAVVAVIAGVAFAVSGVKTMSAKPVTKDAMPKVSASIPATDETTPTADASSSSTSAVEVPNVIGTPLTTGETVIKAAGLTTVTRVASKNTPASPVNAVLSQDPPQGTKVPSGTTITLTYNPKPAPAPVANTQAAPTGLVIAIDPGHQQNGDSSTEPIGPGSSTVKAKVAGGASGASTPREEYKLTLLTSLKLRDILQSRGITVVMIRTTNNVHVSNAERAQIANRAHAALLVRVHFDGVDGSPGTSGISTLYGKGNAWVNPYTAASLRAANLIGNAAAATTGAHYRGAVAHSDMTGLNWATVPSMIIEGGFLSNPTEDARIVTDAYQQKLAQGIANGVMQYLGR